MSNVPPDVLAPEVRRNRSVLSLIAWIFALAGCGIYAYFVAPIEVA